MKINIKGIEDEQQKENCCQSTRAAQTHFKKPRFFKKPKTPEKLGF